MFIGISIGAIVGVLTIVLSPMFGFPVLSMFGFGTLITFVLMGLTIGMVGMFDYHPIFGFRMRWWLRGAFLGFFFTLMYILLGYESLQILIQSSLVSWTGLTSPFWALIDGTMIGLFMGWMETKFAGEGSNLPLR